MNIQAKMPKYKSHKTVYALKIQGIDFGNGENGAEITPQEPGYAPFRVSQEYVDKHQPKTEGYYVIYKDGYKSWSPAEAFEDGYDLISSDDKLE